MKTLIKYHTVDADPNHFWTNVEVGSALQCGEIKTYEEYLKCCNLHGVSPYNEATFDEFIGKPAPVIIASKQSMTDFYENERDKR